MKIKNVLEYLSFESILNLKKNEIKKIRVIRNEKNIRKNMFTKHYIEEREHEKWVQSFKKKKSEKFYVVKFRNEIIGGLGLKNIIDKTSGFWSFYISKKNKINGIGAVIEYMALNYFFKKYRFKNLYCFVLKKNFLVLKLHKKFGFKEFRKIRDNKLKQFINHEVVGLKLTNQNWNILKRKYDKLFKVHKC